MGHQNEMQGVLHSPVTVMGHLRGQSFGLYFVLHLAAACVHVCT
jgi:hypothetical protein